MPSDSRALSSALPRYAERQANLHCGGETLESRLCNVFFPLVTRLQVLVPRGLVCLMSAISLDNEDADGGQKTRFRFEQRVPIPSYLLAIGELSGNFF